MSFPCPCCGYKTFSEEPNGTYDICPVCYWEDDGFQYHDDIGANGITLKQAQKNFAKYGAIKKEFVSEVRLPLPHEKPNSA